MPLNDALNLSQLPDSARRGLRSPRIVTLTAGQILYRFASTSSPAHLWAAGPWWMYEHDYHKIIAQHQQGKLSLGYLGRSAMAVQQSWSKMDVVVKAVVSQDIKAFAGRGRTQYREMTPNGMFITLTGWENVEQLFIPNIGDRNGRTSLGWQALNVVQQQIVSSQQLY
jgi:hypothetical protein